MGDELIGNVVEIGDLVEYQDGAVVSRAVIKKDTGTVTLFAFDTGEGLSEHTAPYDALVYILDGAADVRIGNEDFRVKQGEMLIMPADVPHALKAPERFKMLLVMIRSQS
ncbi:MAG: cupin domain-containing protein [Candidatus Aquicultorales bacterium]